MKLHTPVQLAQRSDKVFQLNQYCTKNKLSNAILLLLKCLIKIFIWHVIKFKKKSQLIAL